ncbi:MAG: hypothetical protein R2752_16635 [Vicinamibacterales bacterium]
MPDSSPIAAAQAVARARAVRLALLGLHKTLIDAERLRYERSRGRIGSPHEFLTLLMQDPFFAWLQPLAHLIIEFDEWINGDGPHEAAAASMLVDQARGLISGDAGGADFRTEYQRALQQSPDVVVAHGRVQGVAASTAAEARSDRTELPGDGRVH